MRVTTPQEARSKMNKEQMQKIAAERGFIAAFDQSGGITPTALRMYMPDIGIEHLLKIRVIRPKLSV